MAGDLLHFESLEGSQNVVSSDVVRRDFLEKLLSTYWVSPGKGLGMSLLSLGLSQGWHRSIATRRRASGQVGREIQVEEVIAERGAVRGVGGGAGTNC